MSNRSIQLFKPHVSEEAVAAVNDVLRSGWIGLGPKTIQFEEAFAAYVGSRFAVALNSATSALHLALLVSGVENGDEVLTTSLSFVSTNHAILYCGAQPKFVDVDDETLNLDLEKAALQITAKTKAIIVVHYGGNPIDINRLYRFAEQKGLKVIEDAAHACGASFGDKKIGSFGLSCFSFHAVKNLPTGDGGMITTDDENIYQTLLRLRWMGIDKSTFARATGIYHWDYEVREVGYKYHMNDINAAIGLEHLKRLDEWNSRRSEIVEQYRRILEPAGVRFVQRTPGAISANHLCVVRVRNRDAIVDYLKTAGIAVGVHYRPNHLLAPYRQGPIVDSLPVTERAYSEIISLPLHLGLSNDDVEFVATQLLMASQSAH